MINLSTLGHPVVASLGGKSEADNTDLERSGVALREVSNLRHGGYWGLERVGAAAPYGLIGGRGRVVVFPNNRMFPTKMPTVATIHDIIHLSHPELIDPAWGKRVARRVRYIIDHADAILCVTHAMAQEVAEAYGVSAERFFIVPCAPPALPAPTPGHPGAPGAVIAVGVLSDSKNLGRLVKAHRMLDARTRKEHPLVLIGAATPQTPALLKEVGYGDEFVWIDSTVGPGDLAAVYANAGVLAQVSMYEGFGMPPVEAMAAQLPTVVSDLAVLREVTGGRADAYVDPYSVESIAQGLSKVVGIDRGTYRVEVPRYSWEASARALEAVIDKVAPLS